jgi:hypothetical protein
MPARIQRRHSDTSSDFQQNLLTSTVHDGAEDKISMKSTTKQASFFCVLRHDLLSPTTSVFCQLTSSSPWRIQERYKTRRICFFPS